MKVCILMGSPRKQGNTASLLTPFCQELERTGHTYIQFNLYSMYIQPCNACRVCQKDWTIFGCPISDDVSIVFDEILSSDLLLLASPIYSWYCTPPMKSLLDRLVYGMNKYYGEEKGPSLWKGKNAALLATCGYPPEKGADLREQGFVRYCRHSQLQYRGMLTERHMGYDTVFMDSKKEQRSREFARKLCKTML